VLVAECERLRPDAVGLSGLLVKSAHQMAVTAQDLQAAGIRVPILVGGAALSEQFTHLRIASEYSAPVLYARDAMQGLSLVNRLLDPATREELLAENHRRGQEIAAAKGARARRSEESSAEASPARSSSHSDAEVRSAPDLELHLLSDVPLEELLPYVNPAMLYGRHLGLKGANQLDELLERGDEKAVKVVRLMRDLEAECIRRQILRPRAVFRFFPAVADLDELLLQDGAGRSVVERFAFPRQSDGERLCLADFCLATRESSSPDSVALFVTTAGGGVREEAERLKQAGEYFRAHAIQALALEYAEGLAELVHQRIRELWGIPDADGTSPRDLFKARYRGVRVSPGYPACPRLEDQTRIFRLVEPEKHLAVRLTEGLMMDPEASVSTLALHNPGAKYFRVDEEAVLRLETLLADAGTP
jgi:5-methyltetrahydrofolate--homocysteine methyltransferase